MSLRCDQEQGIDLTKHDIVTKRREGKSRPRVRKKDMKKANSANVRVGYLVCPCDEKKEKMLLRKAVSSHLHLHTSANNPPRHKCPSVRSSASLSLEKEHASENYTIT